MSEDRELNSRARRVGRLFDFKWAIEMGRQPRRCPLISQKVHSGELDLWVLHSAFTNQTHYEEVTGSARAVNYPVRERRLDLEAKLFEGRPRTCLVESHHRSHLLEPEVLTEAKDLSHQTFAQASPPIVNPNLNSHFADPPRPSRPLCVQAGVARDITVQFSQDSYRSASLDTAHPFINCRRVGYIGAEKQKIVRRQGVRKIQELFFVSRLHKTEREMPSVLDGDFSWIDEAGFEFVHVRHGSSFDGKQNFKLYAPPAAELTGRLS